jgi:hypothetical protein
MAQTSGFACRRLYFANADGHIRTHRAAQRTKNAVFRARLKCREIAFGINLIGNLKDIFGAYGYTQSAALASIVIDRMFIGHK